MKALKAIAWAVAGLTLTNPAHDVTWAQIALGAVCAVMTLKTTGEVMKEEQKHG